MSASELERRFDTVVSRVEVAGRSFELLHPRNADDLITEADYVKDERLPYWADIWPSSIVLAGRVARDAGAAGAMLELGCGLGLVSASAALAGYRVTATDYYDDALEFARENVRRNGGGRLATRMVDWRAFPEDLGRFDLVVASDVLYEHAYAPLLASAFADTLATDGLGIVADPGRIAAGQFVTECEAAGLRIERAERVPFDTGAAVQTIDLYELRRSG